CCLLQSHLKGLDLVGLDGPVEGIARGHSVFKESFIIADIFFFNWHVSNIFRENGQLQELAIFCQETVNETIFHRDP
ncbi:MAG TPA: hypothetical protein PKX69_09725, partial [Limnochordia bacterium]|nr:hypothetical protein [Limnochordia bacterium]